MCSYDQKLFHVILEDCEIDISGSVLKHFPLLVELYDLPSSEVVRMTDVDLYTIGFITHWAYESAVLEIMQWSDILSMIRVAITYKCYRLMWDLANWRLVNVFRSANLFEMLSYLTFDLDSISLPLEVPVIIPKDQHTLASMPLEIVLLIFNNVQADLKSAYVTSFGDHPHATVMRRLL